jgi:hypothetical protein
MPMPKDVKVVDLMMGVPMSEKNAEWYDQFKRLLMDKESRDAFEMPAQYMFIATTSSWRSAVSIRAGRRATSSSIDTPGASSWMCRSIPTRAWTWSGA